MAIPLSMPNSDDLDDGHRLDLLLEQLRTTLRQILIYGRRMAAATGTVSVAATSHVRHRHSTVDRTRTHETESTPEESTRVSAEEESQQSTMQLPLPDLVMDLSAAKEEMHRNCQRQATPESSSSSSPQHQHHHQQQEQHPNDPRQHYHHHHHHHHHHSHHVVDHHCRHFRRSRSSATWFYNEHELMRLADELLDRVRPIAVPQSSAIFDS